MFSKYNQIPNNTSVKMFSRSNWFILVLGLFSLCVLMMRGSRNLEQFNALEWYSTKSYRGVRNHINPTDTPYEDELCPSLTFNETDSIWQYKDKLFVKKIRQQILKTNYSRYEKLIQGNKIRNISFNIYRLAAEDISRVPLRFSEMFKNPCWCESSNWFCLPHFYLIGMPKTGTTDLTARINSHPYVNGRSTFYWTPVARKRYCSSFEKYIHRLPTNYLWKIFNSKGKPSNFQVIAGDFTPTYMWRFFDVQYVKDGHGFGLPDVLNAIQPTAKFIISLRNPVDRLLSDYRNFGGGQMSPEDFHLRVTNTIRSYSHCRSSMEYEVGCIGFEATRHATKNILRLSLGVYSVLIRQWFKVFPREQFFITRLEDRANDCKGTLKRIFEFLEAEPVADEALENLCAKNIHRVTTKNNFQMLDKTKKILECFYQPYNEELATILGDERYLWQK